jgi:hypothetical protein
MKIGYRPGKSHQNADGLSRIPKNLGAIPKTPSGAGVIATVTFTPRKESQATGSVHVITPEIKISEWAKLQRSQKGDFAIVEKKYTSFFPFFEISVPDMTTSHLINNTNLLITFINS